MLVCVLFCSLCSFVLSSGSVGPSLEYGAVEGACLAVLAVKVMSPAFLSMLGGAFVSIGSVIVPWLVGGRRAQAAAALVFRVSSLFRIIVNYAWKIALFPEY